MSDSQQFYNYASGPPQPQQMPRMVEQMPRMGGPLLQDGSGRPSNERGGLMSSAGGGHGTKREREDDGGFREWKRERA